MKLTRLKVVLVAAILTASLLAVGGIVRRERAPGPSEPLALPGENGPTTAGSKWWQTRFAPEENYYGGSVPLTEFGAEKVISGREYGNLDGAKLEEDGGLFLWGWAYDPHAGEVPVGVVVLDRGRQVQAAVRMGRARPDIAEASNNPKLENSGWNARVSSDLVRPGDPLIRVFAILDDGLLGELQGELRIELTGDGLSVTRN